MAKKAAPTLVDALTATLSKHTGEGQSVADLSRATKIPIGRIRERLRLLSYEGRLEVGKQCSLAIDGSTRLVPIYRIKN
jgi:hypothetical protein